MPAALTENFGDLLDARFRKIYDTEYKENVDESMVSMLFGMETSTRNYEKVSGVGGMGDVQDFDGTISYDTIGQLYDKEFSFPEKALGFKVERKLYDDDLFGIMDRRPWQMAVSVARTREKAGAAIWNGAFTGTDGPDSLSLCNTAHPYSPDDATTQSNSGTTAISPTAIEATRRISHTSIFNDRGELASINYDTLLVPVNQEETAWEIINSKGKVDTADNNRNFHSGRYKLAVWDRLTDNNNWWMLDSKLCKMFLLWWDRVKPEFAYDRDFDTLMAKWRTYMRYTAGWADWRPVYGHNVT
ncbi:MAG: hypothetical protein GY774_35720 [Planctomycetes bacterium]|nr:hypothetical protein [Planctomycetota bacterium]